MNHILVVDDEPLMRTWLSKSIPKHSTCFDVPNTARDGIEAIEYLKQAAYDVVITDIKMPGMDGLNLRNLSKKIILTPLSSSFLVSTIFLMPEKLSSMA